MRIAVDATALLNPPTGIGVFTARVLDGLVDRPDVIPVAYAASWRGRHRLHDAVPPSVETSDRPLPARPVRALWQHVDGPPIDWWTGRVDVVHGPNFVVPPSRSGAEVVTVHDLTTVHHPELCHRDTLAFPTLVQRAIDRGALVHTVSDFVADEVRQHFRVDPGAVITVHNGIDPPEGAPTGPPPTGSDPYVLALGTVEPRKDLPTLVQAFDRIADDRPGLQLVVAGADGWGIEPFEAALGAARHRSRIQRLGRVDDDDRRALLSGARVLAYPSRYEGFGLPPLEAMAAGTPVVATRAGALPEVLGDAAVLVDVGDVDGLADGLSRVIGDEALRADLTDRGQARVARYDWSRCVDGLVDIYRQAIERA
jgi:glycosyltransferase involved in cell wall biosynthesis